MMLRSTLLVALAAMAEARKCKDMMVPVSLEARNAVFKLDQLTDSIDVTNFYLGLAKQGGNLTDDLLEGYRNVKGDYKLAATYCQPDDGPGDVLQILTHGVGFDRRYWDLESQNYKYSYVSRAVDNYGYSTLTFDRLGIGHSTLAKDPINELQIFLETEALRAITEKAAEGKLPGVKHKHDSIVHMGHSYGSAMTYDLVNKYPHLSKGIVLTGFSQVPNYMGTFALAANFAPVKTNPYLMFKYPNGYISAGSKNSVHIDFFGAGDFDVQILDFMWRNGQPHGPGELLTVGAGGGTPNVFKGAAMIITGDRDVPFCGGNCMGTDPIQGKAKNLIEYSKPMFAEASAFNATIIPKAGHALFMGYSSEKAFDSIFDFLDASL